MSNLRRFYSEGQIYFVTCVTYRRMPILLDNIDLFWNAYRSTIGKSPHVLIAYVILPDHFHLVIDPGRINLSTFIQRLKMSFAASYRKRMGQLSGRTWQLRFWDHVIRDETDFAHRVDYVHFNPTKHKIVMEPELYEQSSLRSFLGGQSYHPDWCLVSELEFEEGAGE